ncbi:response regulator [Gracilibacillus sp. YIM 98692]|uniref:response regulator transcription factor n=1 Tax=Gracilibacillus sp. YIM 98692 TaxID=2663532 RepID=UPI0013CFFF98|nr:response regulator [Gracilibacillus sp. YIM 98692]
MLNVLVVEDDQLVRKGLISAMPWSNFEMEVVGEASNGKKALEFLENHPVDLVISDIHMPIMSGLEFLGLAKEKYPSVDIAFLTLYQEFEYVQEALRLGAIDFITKTELEKQNFSQVLERLHQRMMEKRQDRKEVKDEAYFSYDQAVVLCLENHDLRELSLGMEPLDTNIAIQEQENYWDLEEKYLEIQHDVKHNNFYMIHLKGLKDRFKGLIYRLLSEYQERLFFYDFSKILHKTVTDLEKETTPSAQQTFTVKRSLFSFKWIYEEDVYIQLKENLHQLKLTKPQLEDWFTDLIIEWNQQSFINAVKLEHRIDFHHWIDVCEWMQSFKDNVALSIGTSYGDEIVSSILKSVDLMNEHLKEGLTADDLASRVNMSRSYFNKSFKEIVGKSFHKYLTDARIARAKLLLENSNQSILMIAEECGYLDEKYFSRIFRQHTGKNPSVYRKLYRRYAK